MSQIKSLPFKNKIEAFQEISRNIQDEKKLNLIFRRLLASSNIFESFNCNDVALLVLLHGNRLDDNHSTANTDEIPKSSGETIELETEPSSISRGNENIRLIIKIFNVSALIRCGL